jgi:hypothetical protein
MLKSRAQRQKVELTRHLLSVLKEIARFSIVQNAIMEDFD